MWVRVDPSDEYQSDSFAYCLPNGLGLSYNIVTQERYLADKNICVKIFIGIF